MHCWTFLGNDEHHQLLLPQCLCPQILQSLHDDNGHQGLWRVLDLLCSHIYWLSMFADANQWLAHYEWCHISKGDYTQPKTQQGSLTAQQPLELLCINFTKADMAKGGKENILVLTDAFSKFSQAFITNNQKSLTVAKVLVERRFTVFRIPARIHSDQGLSFDNEIISHLCKMYAICQSTMMLYNPWGNTQCKQLNRTLFGLMHTLTEEQKPNWSIYLSSLVFTYTATTQASIGFQPYELMFGCKAPMPCDNWLGLGHYQTDSFKSKTVWLQHQLNAMMHANKHALKLINKCIQHNKSNLVTRITTFQSEITCCCLIIWRLEKDSESI